MSSQLKLRATAIAAYESSALKQEDQRRNELLIREIARFLKKFGISVYVNSNPFKIDDVTFYTEERPYTTGDEVEYQLTASRPCPVCKQNILFSDIESLSLEEFGQWLLQSHLCEFVPSNPVNGFAQRK